MVTVRRFVRPAFRPCVDLNRCRVGRLAVEMIQRRIAHPDRDVPAVLVAGEITGGESVARCPDTR